MISFGTVLSDKVGLLYTAERGTLNMRLLLLYRLAVVKRSRVKLAAFFCARLQGFRIFKSWAEPEHRKQLKTA